MDLLAAAEAAAEEVDVDGNRFFANWHSLGDNNFFYDYSRSDARLYGLSFGR